MASYYYCNGTTTRNLPCQLHVPSEGDKCHFHDGGGGPGPKKVASAIFTAGKSAIDSICYIHAASDAVPFAVELANKGLGLFGDLIGIADLYPSELAALYEKNEAEVVAKLSAMDKEQLCELASVSNHLVSLLNEDEGRSDEVYVAAH